ncbi:MAG TPA: carbonic anhydrase [Candidatus Cybelea sp.]|nr:carbonic anhydrase [Candidatus Cybelea sp.]
MRKIFDFASSANPYVADAAVLCCFDHRVRNVVTEFLRVRGIQNADMIIVAGGAKILTSPRNPFDRDFILEQVGMSIRLHHPTRILVISHSDCATYGGLAHFNDDTAAEMEHHRKELCRAAELINGHFPNMIVESYFVNFDGVWASDPT